MVKNKALKGGWRCFSYDHIINLVKVT